MFPYLACPSRSAQPNNCFNPASLTYIVNISYMYILKLLFGEELPPPPPFLKTVQSMPLKFNGFIKGGTPSKKSIRRYYC